MKEVTLEQLCKRFDRAESAFTKNFKRTADKIWEEDGYIIKKEGRGKNTTYTLEKEESENVLKKGSEPFFENNLMVVNVDVQSFRTLIDWDFLVLILLIVLQDSGRLSRLTFRGNYDDFLRYLDKDVTKYTRKKLKEVLERLDKNGYILYKQDKNEPSFFIIGMSYHCEKDIDINIPIFKYCKKISDKHGNKSSIPLIKTWLTIEYLQKESQNALRIKDIAAASGLSEYTVRKSKKILEDENVFLITKKYLGGTYLCEGSEFDYNAIRFFGE